MDNIKQAIMDLAKENKIKGVKIQINNVYQYYRWLSYNPDFLKQKIIEISNKTLENITPEEIDLIAEFKKQQEVVKQLSIYLTSNWTECDFATIEEFINKNPIEDIRRQKLTDKEYIQASKELQCLNQEELYEYIGNINCFDEKIFESEYYNNLTAKEAYIFENIIERLQIQSKMSQIKIAEAKGKTKASLEFGIKQAEMQKQKIKK